MSIEETKNLFTETRTEKNPWTLKTACKKPEHSIQYAKKTLNTQNSTQEKPYHSTQNVKKLKQYSIQKKNTQHSVQKTLDTQYSNQKTVNTQSWIQHSI